jgi:stage V sporulation protein R
MMDEMANHGARLRRYVEKYGEDEVEAFVDRCMSVDDLIDIHSTAIRRRSEVSRYDFTPEKEQDEDEKPARFKSKGYMDDYINPRDVLKAQEEEIKKQKEQVARNFPEQPEKDVLLFLIEHAPLKGWQRDVLSIVRDEAYYFAPQGQTKTINEGWACAERNTLLFTEAGCLRLGDLVDQRQRVAVSDGASPRAVYDWAVLKDRETVRVRTRRGLELEGSTTHRVMLPDGGWKRLDELRAGDRVRMSRGADLWATDYVPISWQPEQRLTLAGVAARAGTSLWTVLRRKHGRQTRSNERIDDLLSVYEGDLAVKARMTNKREPSASRNSSMRNSVLSSAT